jgi:hypothetical protein
VREELFPHREFEHGLGPLLMSRSVPAPRARLGRPELFEAQGKFEGRAEGESLQGKARAVSRAGNSLPAQPNH